MHLEVKDCRGELQTEMKPALPQWEGSQLKMLPVRAKFMHFYQLHTICKCEK